MLFTAVKSPNFFVSFLTSIIEFFMGSYLTQRLYENQVGCNDLQGVGGSIRVLEHFEPKRLITKRPV
jgi:hypothetical protein